MDDRRLISLFLDAQAADLGAATNTQLAYGRDLMDYADWLGKRDVSILDAKRGAIEDYLAFSHATGLAKSTLARRLSAIRQIYRFSFEEGLTDGNPALDIKGPGRDKSLPKTLTVEEVDALLKAVPDLGRSERDRIRNTCLMEILYATGMRVSELVSLPLSTVKAVPDVIVVRGKGGRERMLPLSRPAQAALRNWLLELERMSEEWRGAGKNPSLFLFPSHAKQGHLTRHQFYQLIKKLAVQAGISPAKVTPHTIRHAFATHLLANGADLRAIQTLLGHADVATTEIYTHVLDERLKELVLNHHPLAKSNSDG